MDDFVTYLKSEYLDAVYLQRDAYHEIDTACPAERQKYVFAKIFSILKTAMTFKTKDEARGFFPLTQRRRTGTVSRSSRGEFKDLESRSSVHRGGLQQCIRFIIASNASPEASSPSRRKAFPTRNSLSGDERPGQYRSRVIRIDNDKVDLPGVRRRPRHFHGIRRCASSESRWRFRSAKPSSDACSPARAFPRQRSRDRRESDSHRRSVREPREALYHSEQDGPRSGSDDRRVQYARRFAEAPDFLRRRQALQPAPARIALQAEVDVIVLGGMGLKTTITFTSRTFRKNGAMSRSVMFVHTASDPIVECLLVPDAALAVAEQFATRGKNVLVLLTDMTNFADALKEIAITMEQIPSNRGYPGDLYSQLASRYEKAVDFEARDPSPFSP